MLSTQGKDLTNGGAAATASPAHPALLAPMPTQLGNVCACDKQDCGSSCRLLPHIRGSAQTRLDMLRLRCQHAA